MRLIHMVDVVLLLQILPVLLIFEYFRENTLRARWLALVLNTHVVAARVLNTHASAVHGIELILDTATGAWRPTGSGRTRVTALGDGRPRNVEFGSSARDEVLRLITARLDHETLALLATCRRRAELTGVRTRIDRLPRVLLTRNRVTIGTDLHHTVDEALVLAALILVRAFTMTSFL